MNVPPTSSAANQQVTANQQIATDQVDGDSMLLLRDDYIIRTIAKLERRIGDRFPGSGLAAL